MAVSGGRVLLHRAAGDDFWALPGRRLLQVGETAAEALRREMREEIDADVEVGGLLWVIENFFTHPPLDRHDRSAAPLDHHEVALYLQMTLPPELRGSDGFLGIEAQGTEHEFGLEFRWFDRAEVAGMEAGGAAARNGRVDRPTGLTARLGRGRCRAAEADVE